MNVDYNTETQEITVELNTPAIEFDTPTGGRGLKGDTGLPGRDGIDGVDGRDGLDGQDGEDGVSPIITTSKSGKTTTITIVDADGTKTATILDGEDGASTWGSITGTLSNQTDLQNVLDSKIPYTTITSSSFRVWNENAGWYYFPNQTEIYYKGTGSDTVTIHEGGYILVLPEKAATKRFYKFDNNGISRGGSTSSSGSYYKYISGSEVRNDLLTTYSGYVLDARQGKVLKDLIDAIQVPTKVSDLTNDTGFITNTVNNLTNYYTSSNTYTKTEVDNLIGAVSSLNIEVVQTLPTQDISTSTIYLVPNSSQGTNNYYDEYIYVSNAWELIGSTQVDLSNYYTKTETDTKYALKSLYGDTAINVGRKASTTVGTRSVAEGYNNTASGEDSHAEGNTTTASNYCSHSEGTYTQASGAYSHAEGIETKASGSYAHAEGYGTIAAGQSQHVSGKYNITDNNNTYAEIIGNGTANNSRSNARTLDWSGNEVLAGSLTINGNQTVTTTGDFKTINNESIVGSGNIDVSGGGGTPTDVRVNGTSITSNNVADIQTEGTYNSSTNKIATMSDIPTVPTIGNAKTYYGTSSTSASTAAKTATCSGFTLETGATIFVKFTNANSYNGTATLNVNSTGAKDIATVGDTKTSRYYWKSGEVVGFIYDGTNYVMIEQGNATTTYYGVTKLSSSTSSTSEVLAATPKAVKTAYDLANGKQNAITSTNKLDYSLIDNTPTIPSKTSDLTNDSGFITGYTETDPIFSVSAAAGITSSDITSWNNKSTFSGNYNDLTNKPTIPDSTSDLTNDSGFIDNTVSNLTNYTTTTALQTLLDGKMDYTELTGNSIRIWSLEEGFYINSSFATVYYYGSSDTTNKFTVDAGSIIMISDATNRSSNHKTFLVVTSMGSSCYMGYSTSSAGELYDLLKSSDIKNNLTTSTAGSVLDASQGKALKDLIDAIVVPTKTSDLTNDSGFITSSYHDSTKQDTITATNKLDYSLLSNTPTIPTVPTTVSSFTNDAGYITSSALSGYATTSDLDDVQDQVDANSSNIISNSNKIGTLSNLNTTTKTDLVSAVNEVNTKNIMTTYLAADYSIPNTNTAYDLLNTAVSSSIGTKLTFSGGKIVIGAGVSKVKVSYTVKTMSNANTTRTFTYLMSDVSGTPTALSQEGYWYGGTNWQVVNTYGPIILNVSQGDTFYLRCYGYKGNTIAGATSTFIPTLLTVEVIE